MGEQGKTPEAGTADAQFIPALDKAELNAIRQTSLERLAVTAALEIARNPNEDPQFDETNAYLAIAETQVRLGNTEAALSIAANNGGEWEKTELYRQIAKSQADGGDVAGAISTADKIINDEEKKVQTLNEVAGIQARCGDIDGAYATAARIEDKMDRSEAYTDIAVAKAEAGDTSTALAMIDEIYDDSLQRYVRENVARVQAEAGDIKGALTTANSIIDYEGNERIGTPEAYVYIANACAKAGNINGAYEVAEACRNLNDNSGFEVAYTAIGEAVASTEKQGGGVRLLIDLTEEESCKAALYKGAIMAKARAGRMDEAYGMCESIDPYNMGDAYYAISHIQLETGNTLGALETIRKAESQVTEVKLSPSERRLALEKIAVAMAKADDIAGADSIIDEIMKSEYKEHDPILPSLALRELALAQARKNDFNGAAKTATESDEPLTVYLALAEQAHSMESNMPSLQEALKLKQLGTPQMAKAIGAAYAEEWSQFADSSITPRMLAHLQHGAAQVSESYLDQESRRKLARHLTTELRGLAREGGDSFENTTLLRELSRGLVLLDDPAATGELLKTLREGTNGRANLFVADALIGSGNARAAGLTIDTMCSLELPELHYRYLGVKLAKHGFIDRKLPETVAQLEEGLPPETVRYIISTLHNELGLVPDSTLLTWCADKLNSSGHSDEDSTAQQRAIDTIITELNQQRERFEGLNQKDLLAALAENRSSAIVYYMLNGGRTQFALIRHYSFDKFEDAIKLAQELEGRVDLENFDTSLIPGSREAATAMLQRKRPFEGLSWETTVGASKEEILSSFQRDSHEVLHGQLRWLLSNTAKVPDNFASFSAESVFLREDEDTERRIKSILGSELTHTLSLKQPNLTASDFDKIKPALLNQIRQRRKAAKQSGNQELQDDWVAVLKSAEASEPIPALRHLLPLVTGNPKLSLEPNGAIAEWQGHLNGLQSSMDATRIKASETRRITMRYLDGKDDFAELLRFADAAQCCFTSEDTAGIEMDPAGEWRIRINRDPHWFALMLEDSEPEAPTRQASGFVFGSLARVDGQPALALNGVYLQRKTDMAVNHILDEVWDRLAEPMGIRQMVVAAVHGGAATLDEKYVSAEGHTLIRPRAIRRVSGEEAYNEDVEDAGEDTDSGLESTIYDDLGTVVNREYTIDQEHIWLRRA